jgi:large subunit ribosomal protein L22
MTKALVKNYRQSPRKVRLVADVVRGKKVDVALTELSFMPKRAADPVRKVVESALANAKDNSVATDNLIVKEITVDEGVTLKRWRPKARGTAHPIRKRTSHIKVVLGTTAISHQLPATSKDIVVEEEIKETQKPVKKESEKKINKKPKTQDSSLKANKK